jgi:hypothetical protein
MVCVWYSNPKALLRSAGDQGNHENTFSSDARSAFRLHGGERAALQRLRMYVWGRAEGADAAGASASAVPPPPSTPPSLAYYTDSRAQVRRPRPLSSGQANIWEPLEGQ